MLKNNNNKHFEIWLKAVRAKYDGIGEPFQGVDFDQLLWNYDVSFLLPCSFYYPVKAKGGAMLRGLFSIIVFRPVSVVH